MYITFIGDSPVLLHLHICCVTTSNQLIIVVIPKLVVVEILTPRSY